MTGIGSGEILKYNLEEAAKEAKKTNAEIAKIIGVNKAARVTTVKPSGLSKSEAIFATNLDVANPAEAGKLVSDFMRFNIVLTKA